MKHQYTKKRLLHDLGSYINPYLDAGDDVSRKDKVSLVEEEKCILSAMSWNICEVEEKFEYTAIRSRLLYGAKCAATMKHADKMSKDNKKI